MLGSEEKIISINSPANIIKDLNIDRTSQGIEIWNPNEGKSIVLTSVLISTVLGVTIYLTNNTGNIFATILNSHQPNISLKFLSPYKLEANTPIKVNTENEENICDIYGGSSITQVEYNGREDFKNINNALGYADGSYANLDSLLIYLGRGRLILNYSIDYPIPSYLKITKVVLKFYCRLRLTLAVGISSMILYWRKNPELEWTEITSYSLGVIGMIDYLNQPYEYDITQEIITLANPWDELKNIQTSFVGSHTGLGLGNVILLDAVEIEICINGIYKITLSGYEE